MEKCSSNMTNASIEDKLQKGNTVMRHWPPNKTHFVHPADTFPIPKHQGDMEDPVGGTKVDCLRTGMWRDSPNGSGSGKMQKAGRGFYYSWPLTVFGKLTL